MNTDLLKPRQQRKRQRIMDAALKLFVQFGIQGTSMQLIAKRSELSTGSIYTYFKNKEALISEIYQIHLVYERNHMLEGYNQSSPTRERFEYLIRRSIQFRLEHQDWFHFRSHYVNTPSIMSDAKISETFAGHPLAQVVLDGQAEGLFKTYNIEELFYFANAGGAAVFRWYLSENKEISEQETQRMVDLIWDALTVKKYN